MLIRALKTNQLQFLYSIWAFNKNIELKPNLSLSDIDMPETDSDDDAFSKISPLQRKERI